MKYSMLCAGALLAGALAAVPAHADTVNFSYSGTGSGIYDGVTATGTGSFTTNGTNPASLEDLTAFNFALSVTYPSGSGQFYAGTDSFTYGLDDVFDFSASFVDGQLSALSLATDMQPAQTNYFTAFVVNDLASGDAETNAGEVGLTTTGTITVANPVPEPASMALLATGLLGITFNRRRRV